MSDPKRVTVITVGAPKSAKKIVNRTVRLDINLVESNESKYPELNYKELVTAEERKKHIENGKTPGLDPFSDNDDDVERIAKQFEQKYGGKSTYGKKKARSKQDDFADIGAGYDENDSFIDNTHGYDEMIPPECDTLLGGFYINCGSLEFKTVEHSGSPGEPRRNKRRISSSSSEESSSESSSDSESQGEKDSKAVNGVHSHDTEHRKKKNKKIDKQKAKKLRTDSSAAHSGKQTSDDNNHADGEGESVDSRTSHSDSLTSKPAPSSENAITSDSSRDVDSKMEYKLPAAVTQVLDELESSVAKYLVEHPAAPAGQLMADNDAHIQRLEEALTEGACAARGVRLARARAARALRVSRAKLQQRVKQSQSKQATTSVDNGPAAASHKRKLDQVPELDVSELNDDLREAQIMDTLKRLMDLIEEKKPSMFANYNLECDRVREEKKKLTSEGASHIEKRLPKRRFPWCGESRALLGRLTALAGTPHAAAALLADKVLPMFPKGFVRMPTLMRQANISKDIKIPEVKRQRLGSASQMPMQSQPAAVPRPASPQYTEQIQFPSSLTVTTTLKQSPEKNEPLGFIMNSFSLNKDLGGDREKEEVLYIPPNNIGSITITAVTTKDKKPTEKPKTNETKQPSLIRVKSPAALNESFKTKKIEKAPVKDKLQIIPNTKKDTIPNAKDKSLPTQPNNKRIEPTQVPNKKMETQTNKTESMHVPKKVEPTLPNRDRRTEPLQIDTSFQSAKKDPSPKNKEDTASHKQIESLRVKENNIPRPTLVPIHHSPTFAKPDKRPPDVKKRKEDKIPEETDTKKKEEKVMIVSDLDPLADQEPVAVDDSSSDVEVIENDKSESQVPSTDNSVIKNVPKKEEEVPDKEIDALMRNIREMKRLQDPTFSSNTFSGVITNAKHQRSQINPPNGCNGTRGDKFAERTSLSKTDGSNGVTG